MMDPYNIPVDEAALNRERRKARELRQSQWWKRCCAKGVCHYCGRPTPARELTMDHIVPLARGGRSTKGKTFCQLSGTRISKAAGMKKMAADHAI